MLTACWCGVGVVCLDFSWKNEKEVEGEGLDRKRGPPATFAPGSQALPWPSSATAGCAQSTCIERG